MNEFIINKDNIDIIVNALLLYLFLVAIIGCIHSNGNGINERDEDE